jgi:hypothetical protein
MNWHKDVDYELAHGWNKYWMDNFHLTPCKIYIENCRAITHDDLQILNDLNIIERFDSSTMCCHVHNTYEKLTFGDATM